MKIFVVSSAAVPSPVPNGMYGGLENITGFFAIEAAKRGHDVTLVTCNGSGIRGMNLPLTNLRVMETIAPSWEGDAEVLHYKEYADIMQKEFGNGEGIVWDNTWLGFPYLSKKGFPKMKLLHTHHGMLGFSSPPPVPYPCWLGVSKSHAALMASQLKIPVRHVYNGIYLPTKEQMTKVRNGGYLLSLNRISSEKGIHHCIDIAIQNKVPLVIAGDDTKVASQRYVASIIRRCRESNGLVEYLGLTDNGTKQHLLQTCAAVIAAPEPSWLEAFGLFAVEAMAYGKPVIAVANGGLTEIIESEKNGFLARTPEHLNEAVQRLPEIKTENCLARAQMFTVERMTDRYLQVFDAVMNGDQW